MNLIALLIGLVVERVATRFFHLRRLRWLDRIIDAGFSRAARVSGWPCLIPVTALAVVLVLPVLLVALISLDASVFGIAYLVLAVVVLFFSLGPQDIGEDVDEYCRAIASGDEERIRQTAKAIIESDVPEDERERIRRVEEAVCVQANNRLFAVIFWFILLGPVGAWAYRVTDLIRRRAVFGAARDESEDDLCERLKAAATDLHGALAWIPARLTAIGYAIAGNFDDALAAWRTPGDQEEASFAESSEQLLGRVGIASLSLPEPDATTTEERGIDGARAANRLVFRLLIIWAVVIAAMTLYGWTL